MAKPAPEAAVHTLPSLVTALGSATLDALIAEAGGADKTSLVASGAKVVTTRITTDAARIYGEAYDFLEHASPEQLEHLPVFDKDALRIAVWGAAEGERRYEVFTGKVTTEATKQATAAAQLDDLTARLDAKRGQLHTALVAIAAGDGKLLAQADVAYGTVADLGGAVHAMTKLVRDWRETGPADVRKRFKKTRLGEAWLASADALATEYVKVETSASATRSKGGVTQADVDWVDGMNLRLLKSTVAQFEAAHAADPTIPRLAFNALHSHVGRAHRKTPQPVTPTTPQQK